MRSVLVSLGCLALLLAAPASAPAQNLPADCRQAMSVRSPQTQVELFTRCLDSGGVSGPTRADVLKQRAISYMHLGQHQRAVDDIDEALRLRPDADGYYLRSVSLRALGRLDSALQDCDRAISMEPDNAPAYANRAYIYQALGNKAQARSDARRARELDSSVRVPWL